MRQQLQKATAAVAVCDQLAAKMLEQQRALEHLDARCSAANTEALERGLEERDQHIKRLEALLQGRDADIKRLEAASKQLKKRALAAEEKVGRLQQQLQAAG